MIKRGFLFVLSGPSGVGKGTILREYLKDHPECMLSVSATTRAPREGEVNGVDYYFLTREDFESQIDDGSMLEYTEYDGNYYGTPRKALDDHLANGKHVILEIEVKGARLVRKAIPNAVSIFVMPPSFEVLRQRLQARNSNSSDSMVSRLSVATREISAAVEYDYAIVNNTIEESCKRLDAIITASTCCMKLLTKYINKEGIIDA